MTLFIYTAGFLVLMCLGIVYLGYELKDKPLKDIDADDAAGVSIVLVVACVMWPIILVGLVLVLGAAVPLLVIGKHIYRLTSKYRK